MKKMLLSVIALTICTAAKAEIFENQLVGRKVTLKLPANGGDESWFESKNVDGGCNHRLVFGEMPAENVTREEWQKREFIDLVQNRDSIMATEFTVTQSTFGVVKAPWGYMNSGEIQAGFGISYKGKLKGRDVTGLLICRQSGKTSVFNLSIITQTGMLEAMEVLRDSLVEFK